MYKKINLIDIPTDSEGRVLQNLYAHIPRLNMYPLFVPKGEEITESKRATLNNSPDKSLYIRDDEAVDHNDLQKMTEEEVLGPEAEKQLKGIFAQLINPKFSGAEVLKKVEALAEAILKVVAPEVVDLKTKLLKNTKYLHLMNDAAAITSLAVLFGYASGFTAQRVFRDLSTACLLMDISLVDLTEDEKSDFYLERNELVFNVDLSKKIHAHPLESCHLIRSKMPKMSESVLSLIQYHHELFNGKGFPRGIRSESLFPISKVLSLAVDVHWQLKKAELERRETSLINVLYQFKHEPVEQHMRRHARKLVDEVVSYVHDSLPTEDSIR